MKRPKISIIVPTCDRPNLLDGTLRGLLLADYADCEVLVSDNFSDPRTRAVVDAISDPRLRYIRTACRMGLCDHWEFAIAHAVGEYFIINGDDDGLTPDLLPKLDAMIQEGYQLISWITALYFHPDWDHDEGGNVLQISRPVSGQIFTFPIRNIITEYTRLRRDFFPEITRVCCKLSLAHNVIRRTGRFFWPLSVDLTSSLLLLGELKDGEFALIDSYMGYGGRSKVSNAAAYERCTKSGVGGDMERADRFYKEHGDIDFWPWHPLKTKAYWNGHAAAWSLFCHWHSEWTTCKMDTPVLLGRILAEVYGITNANPFLNDNDLAHINKYVWGLPSDEIRNTYIECLKLCSYAHADLQEVLRQSSLFINSHIDRDDKDFVLSIHAAFTRGLEEWLNTTQGTPQQRNVENRPHGVKRVNGVDFFMCDSLSINNGFELTQKLRAISDLFFPGAKKTE